MFNLSGKRENIYELRESAHLVKRQYGEYRRCLGQEYVIKSVRRSGNDYDFVIYLRSKKSASDIRKWLKERPQEFKIEKTRISEAKFSDMEYLYLNTYLSGETRDHRIYEPKMMSRKFKELFELVLNKKGKTYLLDIGCWNEQFLEHLEKDYFSKHKNDHLLIGTDSGIATCYRDKKEEMEDEMYSYGVGHDIGNEFDDNEIHFVRTIGNFKIENKDEIEYNYKEAQIQTGILNDLKRHWKRADILRCRFDQNLLTVHGFYGDFEAIKHLFKKVFLDNVKFDAIFLRRMFPYVYYNKVFDETQDYTKHYFIIDYNLGILDGKKPWRAVADDLKKRGFKILEVRETKTFYWLVAKKIRRSLPFL
ncbi:hypothetical protein ACFLQI_01240 [Candidatus Undinarchaeota archaeon]